jgi:large subunit ribosomal protein L9e
LNKSFKHSRVEISIGKNNTLCNVEMWFGNRKERARTRTIASHIANMIKGVTKGYEYKMRMVYAHFPINVNLEDNNRTVAIRNFLGEKKVMKVALLDGTHLIHVLQRSVISVLNLCFPWLFQASTASAATTSRTSWS